MTRQVNVYANFGDFSQPTSSFMTTAEDITGVISHTAPCQQMNYMVALPDTLGDIDKFLTKEEQSTWELQATETVEIYLIPDGDILRIGASIGLALIAGPLAGAIGFTAGTVGYAIAQTLIFGVGSLLINAIFPPETPSFGNYSPTNTPGASPTYNLNDRRNTARLGQIRPTLYGRFQIVPDLMNRPYRRIIDNELYFYGTYYITNGDCSIEQFLFANSPASGYDEVDIVPHDVNELFGAEPDRADYNSIGIELQNLEIQLPVNGLFENLPDAFDSENDVVGDASYRMNVLDTSLEVNSDVYLRQEDAGIIEFDLPTIPEGFQPVFTSGGTTGKIRGTIEISYIDREGLGQQWIFDVETNENVSVARNQDITLYHLGETQSRYIDNITRIDFVLHGRNTTLPNRRLGTLDLMMDFFELRIPADNAITFETYTNNVFSRANVYTNPAVTEYRLEKANVFTSSHRVVREADVLDNKPIEIDVEMPGGVGYIGNQGGIESRTHTVEVLMEYTTEQGTTGEYRNQFSITGATRTAQRRTFHIDAGAPDRNNWVACRVSVARLTDQESLTDTRAIDDMFWTRLRGIFKFTPQPYPGRAFSIRARATNNMTEAVFSQLSVVATRILPVYKGNGVWENETTRNPMWACLDMLMNNTYGSTRFKDTQIDLDTALRIAGEMDEADEKFDIVFDAQIQTNEAVGQALNVGRANFFIQGGIVSFHREKPETSVVTTFSPLDIVGGSYGTDIRNETDNSFDSVEVEFLDESRSYTPNIARHPATGINPKISRLTGVVRAEQSLRHAKWLFLNDNHIRTTLDFTTGTEGLRLTAGDLIQVAYNPIDEENVLAVDISKPADEMLVIDEDNKTAYFDMDGVIPPNTTHFRLIKKDGIQTEPMTFERDEMNPTRVVITDEEATALMTEIIRDKGVEPAKLFFINEDAPARLWRVLQTGFDDRTQECSVSCVIYNPIVFS